MQNLISGLQEQSGVHVIQKVFLIIFVHTVSLLHSNKRQEILSYNGDVWFDKHAEYPVSVPS